MDTDFKNSLYHAALIQSIYMFDISEVWAPEDKDKICSFEIQIENLSNQQLLLTIEVEQQTVNCIPREIAVGYILTTGNDQMFHLGFNRQMILIEADTPKLTKNKF